MNYLKFKKIISTIVLASSMTLAACAVPNVPEEGIQVTVDGKVYTVKNATEEEAKNPSVMDITTDGGNIEVKTNNDKKDFTVETSETKTDIKTETKTETKTTDGKAVSNKSAAQSTIGNKGIAAELFTGYDVAVTTSLYDKKVCQSAEVNGRKYLLGIYLEDWEGETTPEQIVEITKLFWQAYPLMYERFGTISGAKTNVGIVIEDGSAAAYQGNDCVFMGDEYLKKNPTDYDSVTYALANLIQRGWDAKYLEYSNFADNFARYCRYVYAYNNGEYNDSIWLLPDVNSENSVATSVRFLVYLDEYFSDNKDFMQEFFKVCSGRKYAAKDWDQAWAEILKDTELEGKTESEVWEYYKTSPFATASAVPGKNGKSEIEISYFTRSEILGR
ncbi:MAG: hypothetical protein J5537_06870 [Lachnospiraceae bacterium]|nr:hypothetical protein [Lachnospiraceae bacterium]